MPMDDLMWNNEAFNRRCLGWKLEYSLLPRRCYYTGKYLWLKLAYKGTAMLTGPGEPLFADRWCERREFLFLKIKGII